MIEAAGILSAVVGKWEDFGIIGVMLLVNAGLDFLQEHRALNALRALKQHLSAEIIALRGGRFLTVPARDLVPGDILRCVVAALGQDIGLNGLNQGTQLLR